MLEILARWDAFPTGDLFSDTLDRGIPAHEWRPKVAGRRWGKASVFMEQPVVAPEFTRVGEARVAVVG